MRQNLFTLAAVLLSAVALASISERADAQSSNKIRSGVVVSVQTNDRGELDSFSMVDPNGEIIAYNVSSDTPNTQYGLDSDVGDRWVSDQASDPAEAAVRLSDQQQRQARITVDADVNGFAHSVVQAEGSSLASSLGYLFAAAIITWLAFAGYIIYMARRQRVLSSQIERLQKSMEKISGQSYI